MPKQIPLAKPWFSQEEPQAAFDTVKSKWLISGPKVEQFEQEFAKKINAKYAVAVNSGSSALLIVQQALGIGQGDEAIVPNMTFVSTASSLLYLKAIPVLADIELKTYCLDPDDIEKRITEKTKAIIPVHYAGQTANMAQIMEVARKHNLKVIEDAAEAHLAKFQDKFAGTIGNAAIFSFTPSKPMTTGEGGMITTNDSAISDKCRSIRNYCDKSKFEWTELGFNFRMPEVMAAIGLVQLKKLKEAIKIRRVIAAKYNSAFKSLGYIIPPFVRSAESTNFQLYTIRLDLDELDISRDQFIEKLSNAGVQSRLYYPCLHKQKVFGKCKNFCHDEEFPKTIQFSKSALSLPIYPGLTEEEIAYIISTVKEICLKHLSI